MAKMELPGPLGTLRATSGRVAAIMRLEVVVVVGRVTENKGILRMHIHIDRGMRATLEEEGDKVNTVYCLRFLDIYCWFIQCRRIFAVMGRKEDKR